MSKKRSSSNTVPKIRRSPQGVGIALYDALTAEIERSGALAKLLAQRLEEETGETSPDVYALSLLADIVCEKHDRILERAKSMLASGGGR